MGSTLSYQSLKPDQSFSIGQVKVLACELNHTKTTLGYRFEFEDLIVAYVTDTEHFPDRLDENVIRLAQDADVLVYDGMYTDEQYSDPKSPKVGWGHSTWQEGIKIAKKCSVKKLFIFHHDPINSDKELKRIEKQFKKGYRGGEFCREGREFLF